MGRVKKSSIVLLFSLVLILLISSLSFAITDIVDNGACAASGGVALFYTTDNTNAHASTTQGGYGYSVCYSSLTGTILKPATPNQCLFANKIVGLSSATNAHVEGPASNTYDVSVCYANLDCRLGSEDEPLGLGEQVLAKLSDVTDAHIASAAAPKAQYPQVLICKEPICDATDGRATVFPLISGFDAASQNLGAYASNGAIAEISTTHPYTGASSLKISFPIPEQTAGAPEQSVDLTMGNKGNWAGYDYLEFYLYAEQSLGIYLKTVSKSGGVSMLAISSAYAPAGIYKERWNLIRIPIVDLGVSSGVASVSFVAAPALTTNFLASTTYSYYIDSMQLSSKSTTNSDFQKYYCAQKADGSFAWNTQLSNIANAWLAKIAPLANITANGNVCGEQPGDTYADGTNGCFNSVAVNNNTPIDFLIMGGLGVAQPQICTGSLCRTYLPPQRDAFSITKLSAEGSNFVVDSYNLKLRDGEFKSAGAQGAADNIIAYSLVKPRVVYGSQFTFSGTSDTVASSTTPGFYSCGSVPAQYQSNQITALSAPSTPKSVCPVIGQYACSPSGFFAKQSNSATGTPVNAFVSSSYRDEVAGCCSATSCWGDGACRPDQTNSPLSASFGATATDPGYRCYAGEWKRGVPKVNYDGSKAGFCPVASQCFVTDVPAQGTPSCINSDEYYQNFYCDGGNWTTRTAILAGQMIKYAQDKNWNKGTLYCDHYSVALNVIDNSKNVANIFDGLVNPDADGRSCASYNASYKAPDIYNDYSCVNSFCVFAPDNAQPIFGTSLNKPFASVTDLNKVFVDGCQSLSGDSFQQCGNSLYQYNPQLQLVLYNPNERGFITVTLDALRNYILNPIARFFTNTPSITQQFALASESKLFSRFYFTVNPDVSITAFYEVRYNVSTLSGKPYYIFKIETDVPATDSPRVDLCADIVGAYNKREKLTPQNAVSCSQTTSNGKLTTVIVGDQKAYGLWPKLTANLRPS